MDFFPKLSEKEEIINNVGIEILNDLQNEPNMNQKIIAKERFYVEKNLVFDTLILRYKGPRAL